MEFSIPARLAFMFLMLIMANKEWRRFDDINEQTPWKDIGIAGVSTALYTYIAGVFLYEALVDIITQTV